MKLTKKRFLLLGAALLVTGLLLMLTAFAVSGFDLAQLNGERLTLEAHTLDEVITEIDVYSRELDVRILPLAEGKQAQVIVPKGQNLHHNVTLKDGKLSIETVDARPWHEKMSFFLPDELTTIEIRLPAADYQLLNVFTSSGDVSVDGGAPASVFFEKTKIETASGAITYRADMPKSTPFDAFDVRGTVWLISSSGDIAIGETHVYIISTYTTSGNTVVSNSSARSSKLETSSGDILLQGIGPDPTSVHDLKVTTASGAVMLADLTTTSVQVSTSSGDINIAGGYTARCDLKSNSGDVNITDYEAHPLYIETSSGDVLCDGISARRFEVSTSSGDITCPESAKKGDYCAVKTNSGDVCIINSPAN